MIPVPEIFLKLLNDEQFEMNKLVIATAMASLAAADSDVARGLQQVGLPAPRVRPQGFEALLNIIVSQQISTEAASAVMGRVKNLLSGSEAQSLLSVSDLALREAGMSFRKIEYAKGLADAIVSGSFDVQGLESLDDSEAITAICSLRGFGHWSAEIYLMFSLNRQDIFPADDLALLVALGRLKGLATKPTPKVAREMVVHWAPWRSVGSLFLWRYYRGALV
jgi:DNA-3-methyladenine glycosylase II